MGLHEPSSMQIRSRIFAPGVCTKKGHYKQYLGVIPYPTKFNQNWHTSSGRRRNQPYTKFDNDRSREYKVTRVEFWLAP